MIAASGTLVTFRNRWPTSGHSYPVSNLTGLAAHTTVLLNTNPFAPNVVPSFFKFYLNFRHFYQIGMLIAFGQWGRSMSSQALIHPDPSIGIRIPPGTFGNSYCTGMILLLLTGIRQAPRLLNTLTLFPS